MASFLSKKKAQAAAAAAAAASAAAGAAARADAVRRDSLSAARSLLGGVGVGGGSSSSSSSSSSSLASHEAVLRRLSDLSDLSDLGMVHPDTPEAFFLRGRASRAALERARAVAAAAKTGDVVLFSNMAPSPVVAAFVKLQTALTGGEPWTHAGIVLCVNQRRFVLESVLAPLAQGCDVIEGAMPSRLNGSIRIFPLVERVFAYDGGASLLPLRAPLSADSEDALLRAATTIWRRNPDFDVEQLVAAGFDRMSLVRLLSGNRSEPKEDLDAFFCSELVGHLLEVAGVLSHDVNVSKLAPNDLLSFTEVLAVEALRPIRTLPARKVLDVERHHLRVDDAIALVANLRTGDIVLVRGSHSFGAAVRIVDGGARWDHVGVVVKAPHDAAALSVRSERLASSPLPARSAASSFSPPVPGQLQLLEATGDGTFAYPFLECLKERGDRYQYVGVRRLHPPLGPEACGKVERHLMSTLWGRPYEQNLAELLGCVTKKVSSGSDVAHGGGSGQGEGSTGGEEDLRSIFCSELVAEVYQAAGLLPEQSLNSNDLAPSAFMHGGAVDCLLVGDSSLGGAALLLKAPEDDFDTAVLHSVP
jgi:hypothetical protein